MSSLYRPIKRSTPYVDRQFPRDPSEYQRALDESCTLYVGNLSFYTREEQLHETFHK